MPNYHKTKKYVLCLITLFHIQCHINIKICPLIFSMYIRWWNCMCVQRRFFKTHNIHKAQKQHSENMLILLIVRLRAYRTNEFSVKNYACATYFYTHSNDSHKYLCENLRFWRKSYIKIFESVVPGSKFTKLNIRTTYIPRSVDHQPCSDIIWNRWLGFNFSRVCHSFCWWIIFAIVKFKCVNSILNCFVDF